MLDPMLCDFVFECRSHSGFVQSVETRDVHIRQAANRR